MSGSTVATSARRMACTGLLACAAVAGDAAGARAQDPVSLRTVPELRADLLLGRRPAVQVGAGVQLPIGYYVRVGLVGAVGARLDDAADRGGGSRADARLDLLARFLLDPFRQSRYGLSVGGGMSVRAEPGDRARPLLLVALEVEGPRRTSGVVPAVQVGLGGGVRVGFLLRRAPATAR